MLKLLYECVNRSRAHMLKHDSSNLNQAQDCPGPTNFQESDLYNLILCSNLQFSDANATSWKLIHHSFSEMDSY